MQRQTWGNAAAVASVLVGLVTAAAADVPREITYQGMLTGNGTDPVSLEVRFYDAATGGNLLWSELHPSVPRPEGLFSINIGSQTVGGVPDSALVTPEVWLALSVNSGSELTPRTRFVMVPYAAKASLAESVCAPDTGTVVLERDPNAADGIGVRIPRGVVPIVRMGARSSSGAGLLQFYSADGTYVAGIGGGVTGGSALQLKGYGGYDALCSFPGEGGGRLDFYDGAGSLAISMTASEVGTTRSPEIGLYNQNGRKVIEIDADDNNTQNPFIRLRSADGAERVTIYGDSGGVGKVKTQVLQITGGSDLAEPFTVAKSRGDDPEIEPGMVVSIDPENPGRLRLATEPYDLKVAGIISGAKGLQPGMVMKSEEHEETDGDHPVALTGRVWCWCDASYGMITPGDRLTTSTTSGHAMKVTEEGRAPGAVIGKAMTKLDEGKGLVLILVQPQ